MPGPAGLFDFPLLHLSSRMPLWYYTSSQLPSPHGLCGCLYVTNPPRFFCGGHYSAHPAAVQSAPRCICVRTSAHMMQVNPTASVAAPKLALRRRGRSARRRIRYDKMSICSLPEEVLSNIVRQCDMESIFTLMATSKVLAKIARSPKEHSEFTHRRNIIYAKSDPKGIQIR